MVLTGRWSSKNLKLESVSAFSTSSYFLKILAWKHHFFVNGILSLHIVALWGHIENCIKPPEVHTAVIKSCLAWIRLVGQMIGTHLYMQWILVLSLTYHMVSKAPPGVNPEHWARSKYALITTSQVCSFPTHPPTPQKKTKTVAQLG